MTTDAQTQAEAIESLLEDEDFEKLEEIAQGFNIFEVLGAVRQEIRHSNVLAWLLNPDDNHGLGDYFLKRFLWTAGRLAREQGKSGVGALEAESLNLDLAIVEREWRGLDLLIRLDTDQHLWVVENKVYSREHSDQLGRYLRECQAEFPSYRRSFIFLTATATEPSDPSWVTMRYDDVAALLERVLASKEKSLSFEVKALLADYRNIIRRHIMGESEIETLCRRLYARHRQALDLLFEFRVDVQSQVRRILEDAIREYDSLYIDHSTKAYIRFAPAAWEPEDERLGDGRWTSSKRMLLFEFSSSANALSLALIIGPGDDSTRQALGSLMRGVEPLRVPSNLGRMWATIWRKRALSSPDYDDWDVDAVTTRLGEFVRNFVASELPMIDKAVSTSLATFRVRPKS